MAEPSVEMPAVTISAPGVPVAGLEPAKPVEPAKTPAKAPAKTEGVKPPKEEMRQPRQEAAPAKGLLSIPLTQITDTTIRGLLADAQPVIQEIGTHKTAHNLKTLFGTVFGIGSGAAFPATELPKVITPLGSTALSYTSAPFVEQALHMGTEAGGVGLAVGGVAAGVQIATDAIRVLGLREDHRHLLIRTLLRTKGGPEAWMMRKIALGNRGHIKALIRLAEKEKQGLFDWAKLKKNKNNNKYLQKMVVSAFEAMAGLQTVDFLAPKKVADAIIAKEGKDSKSRYLEEIHNAFNVAQDIYTKVFEDADRTEFNKKFSRWMKNRAAGNTTKAILSRGAYQIVRIGPWALAGSLAAGLFKTAGEIEGIKRGVNSRWEAFSAKLPTVDLAYQPIQVQQLPTGINIVNGKPVLEGLQYTGGFSGQVLKFPTPK